MRANAAHTNGHIYHHRCLAIVARHRLPILFLVMVFAVGLSMLLPTSRAAATCVVPNTISNGQVADASAVMGNFNALANCADSAVQPSGIPAAGHLTIFSGPNSITPGNLSGDCSTAGTVAVTCTKTNGALFGYFATGTDAGQLTGTVSVNRFNNGASADSSHYLRGDGVWGIPSGGGAGNWWAGHAPLAADFTLATGDATNLTLTDDADVGLMIDSGASVATNIVRYAYRAAPNGDWTVTMRVVSPPIGGVLLPGIIAVESSTGKYYIAGPQANASGMIRRYGVVTGTVTNTLTSNVTFARPWVRVSRIGSNILTYLSADGKSWSPLAWDTVALTTAFTAAPDRVGVGLFSSQANSRLLFSTDYWIQSF